MVSHGVTTDTIILLGGAGGDGGADWVSSGTHCPLPDVEEDQQVGSHGGSCFWPMARPGRLVDLCQGMGVRENLSSRLTP